MREKSVKMARRVRSMSGRAAPANGPLAGLGGSAASGTSREEEK